LTILRPCIPTYKHSCAFSKAILLYNSWTWNKSTLDNT